MILDKSDPAEFCYTLSPPQSKLRQFPSYPSPLDKVEVRGTGGGKGKKEKNNHRNNNINNYDSRDDDLREINSSTIDPFYSKPKRMALNNLLDAPSVSFDGRENVDGNRDDSNNNGMNTKSIGKRLDKFLDAFQCTGAGVVGKKGRKMMSGLGLRSMTSDACSNIPGFDDQPEEIIASWKIDPKRSMSNHTLVVTVDGDDSTSKEYHVHKSIIMTGVRRSEYLSKLVLTTNLGSKGVAGSFFEGESNRVEMMEKLNDAVPKSSPLNYFRAGRQRKNVDMMEHKNCEDAPGDDSDIISPTATMKTRIDLPYIRAAEIFPLLLDYVYFDDLSQLTAKNAPPLRYLANRMDVRPLHDLVTDFVRNDLSKKNAHIYCPEARTVGDRDLTSASLRKCAEGMSIVDCGAEVSNRKSKFASFQPDLFAQLVSSPHGTCTSEVLSGIVASYLRDRQTLYPDARDSGRILPPVHEETFQLLTHVRVLPRISSAAAPALLCIAADSFPRQLRDDGSGASSLESRCLTAFAREWRNMPIIGNDNNIKSSMNEEYRRMPDKIKLKILETALHAARGEVS